LSGHTNKNTQKYKPSHVEKASAAVTICQKADKTGNQTRERVHGHCEEIGSRSSEAYRAKIQMVHGGHSLFAE